MICVFFSFSLYFSKAQHAKSTQFCSNKCTCSPNGRYTSELSREYSSFKQTSYIFVRVVVVVQIKPFLIFSLLVLFALIIDFSSIIVQSWVFYTFLYFVCSLFTYLRVCRYFLRQYSLIRVQFFFLIAERMSALNLFFFLVVSLVNIQLLSHGLQISFIVRIYKCLDLSQVSLKHYFCVAVYIYVIQAALSLLSHWAIRTLKCMVDMCSMYNH